jgi:hypothetical protein
MEPISIGDPVRINSNSDYYEGLVGTFVGFDGNGKLGKILPINASNDDDDVENGRITRFHIVKLTKISIEEFVMVKLENA